MFLQKNKSVINRYAPPNMDNFFIFRGNTHSLRNFQITMNENKKKNSKIGHRDNSCSIGYRTTLPWANSQRNSISQVLWVNLNRK